MSWETGTLALPLTDQPTVHNGPYWLTSSQFAGLAGMSEQAAQKALLRATEGHAWNGTALRVRKEDRQDELPADERPAAFPAC